MGKMINSQVDILCRSALANGFDQYKE